SQSDHRARAEADHAYTVWVHPKLRRPPANKRHRAFCVRHRQRKDSPLLGRLLLDAFLEHRVPMRLRCLVNAVLEEKRGHAPGSEPFGGLGIFVDSKKVKSAA